MYAARKQTARGFVVMRDESPVGVAVVSMGISDVFPANSVTKTKMINGEVISVCMAQTLD